MPSENLNHQYQFYQKRFNAIPRYYTHLELNRDIRLLIVIPSYKEDLNQCLNSLSKCTIAPGVAEVLLVFNNEAEDETAMYHLRQYEHWHGHTLSNGIRVQAIAALDLPSKTAGVGMARKIGMDAALSCFSRINYDGLIVCLDADCEVAPNYLEELLRAEKGGVNGLSIYFEHPINNLDSDRRERIVYYETWLRYYIQALRSIGYPHAFHTVGSSMAVRASVYARIGGMNRRKAGEDFYFLHKLIPHGKYYDLTSTCVYPSARDSERVPFGTGRAMLDAESGRKNFRKVYNPEIFRAVQPLMSGNTELLRNPHKHSSEALSAAIEALGWQGQFNELCVRSSNDSNLIRNFHYWFDGFRMLKLVHWMQDNYFDPEDTNIAVYKVLDIKAQEYVNLLNTLREKDRDSTFVLGRNI